MSDKIEELGITKDQLIDKLLDVLTSNALVMKQMQQEMAELRKAVASRPLIPSISEEEALRALGAPTKHGILRGVSLGGSGIGSTPAPAHTIMPACQHEYPQTWGSTLPPPCTKCGQLALPHNYINTAMMRAKPKADDRAFWDTQALGSSDFAKAAPEGLASLKPGDIIKTFLGIVAEAEEG